MAAGLSSTGFELKTIADVLAEIEADLLRDIDPNLDLSADQPIGQINGIFAKKIAEAWELLQTAFGAFDDTAAEGSLLEALAALTGTTREAARKGSVSVSCTLLAGTTLPGTVTIAASDDANNRWVIAAAYTAAAGGAQPVLFRAEHEGPIPALAGKLTSIVTPVAGWTACTNPLDASPGANLETIEALRVRRREELQAQGSCNLPALHAALLRVAGVTSALVRENYTSTTVGTLPPNSFEAIVWDGVAPAALDNSIRATVWANKPAGIQPIGTTAGTLVDDQGVTRSVPFSRATQDPITVAVSVTKDPTTYPADGDARIKAAILACGGGVGKWFGMGGTIYLERIRAIAMFACPGVLDITSCTINTLAANHAVAATAIGTFDNSRITVTS